MGKIFFYCFCLLASGFLLTACGTVPYSERSQLLLTNETTENRLGEESWKEICSKEKESSDTALKMTVRKVGERIAKAANRPDFIWEFKVFDSGTANAFCLPGGKVAVYTGILKYMNNEAELATVMGHEVGHAIARHGGERMSQNMVQSIGATALNTALNGRKEQALANSAYGLASQYGVLLPYSRTHEYEADVIGLMLMAKAGYDPNSALVFWKKFGSETGAGMPEFLSTHPVGENRIENMKQYLPQALEYYRKTPERFGTGSALSCGKRK